MVNACAMDLMGKVRGGEGNFRFTAAANCLAGTPFFPVAYHKGPAAFSIGLESPGLLQEAFEQSKDIQEAKAKLRTLLESELGSVEKLALGVARNEHRQYLGIDVSPAPPKEVSIGSAIEALTRVPFGSASTLAACAAITDVLHSLSIKTCGPSNSSCFDCGQNKPRSLNPRDSQRKTDHRRDDQGRTKQERKLLPDSIDNWTANHIRQHCSNRI